MLTLCRANGKARVELISPQRAQRAQRREGKELSSWSSCPLWLKTGLTRRALGQPTRRVGARGLQVDFATESTKACRNGFFFAVYVFFVAKNPFGEGGYRSVTVGNGSVLAEHVIALPHPGPLPNGEGEAFPARGENHGPLMPAIVVGQFLLPGGGQDEGEPCPPTELFQSEDKARGPALIQNRDPSAFAGGCEICSRACMPFWAIGYQALASRSKPVQVSRTIIFDGLTLTGLTAT